MFSWVPLAAAEPAILSAVAPIAARVAELRGAPDPGPLDVAVMSEAELAEMLREAIESEPSRPTWPAQERMLRRLGLLPDDAGLEQSFASALGGQIAGFYDPRSQKLFLVDRTTDEAVAIQQGVLAHEIAHALDDRGWHIAEMKAGSRTLDEQLVTDALIEGSATWQMMRFLVRELASGQMSMADMSAASKLDSARWGGLDDAPPYVLTSLMAPYIVGMLWVGGGGIDPARLTAMVDPERARLDAAVRAPPASTAALLHPGQPALVHVPGAWATLPELRVEHEDRVGELLIAAGLRGGLPKSLASMQALDAWTSREASGWLGDGFLVASRADGRPVEAWWSAWASRADRDEFLKKFSRRRAAGRADAVGDRALLLSWGLEDAEARGLVRALQAAAWEQGGSPWSP